MVALIDAGCSNTPAETGTGSSGGNKNATNRDKAVRRFAECDGRVDRGGGARSPPVGPGIGTAAAVVILGSHGVAAAAAAGGADDRGGQGRRAVLAARAGGDRFWPAAVARHWGAWRSRKRTTGDTSEP
jgi:hypothetical protein